MPKAASFMMISALTMISGIATHMLISPRPVGLRQVQVQADDRRDEGQRVQPGDLGEGR